MGTLVGVGGEGERGGFVHTVYESSKDERQGIESNNCAGGRAGTVNSR